MVYLTGLPALRRLLIIKTKLHSKCGKEGEVPIIECEDEVADRTLDVPKNAHGKASKKRKERAKWKKLK